MAQMLLDWETGARPYAEGRHRASFEEFHAEHPEVYEELRRRALQVKAGGRRVGLRCLLESLRWSWAIGDSERWWGEGRPARFKVDGNHQSYYRDLLNADPELKDFFPVRKSGGT